MSRKHFVAIAASFQELLDATDTPASRDATIVAARAMADVFATCNRNFDRSRFLSACGI